MLSLRTAHGLDFHFAGKRLPFRSGFAAFGGCESPVCPAGMIDSYVCYGRFSDLSLTVRAFSPCLVHSVAPLSAMARAAVMQMGFTAAGTVPDSHRIPFSESDDKVKQNFSLPQIRSRSRHIFPIWCGADMSQIADCEYFGGEFSQTSR